MQILGMDMCFRALHGGFFHQVVEDGVFSGAFLGWGSDSY